MRMKTLFYLFFVFLIPGISHALPIPDIDPDDTWLRFGSAPKSYDATTDIFSVSLTGGATLINFAGVGSMDGVGLNGFLTANIDEYGTLHGGSFNITGDWPSMGIPSGTTFLSGAVVGIETVGLDPADDGTVDTYVVEFLLRIDMKLPELGFDTGYAVWENIISAATGPVPNRVEDLYTVDWGPLGAATYDHINEVKIPEPASITLLCVGLAGLGFARLRKLH